MYQVLWKLSFFSGLLHWSFQLTEKRSNPNLNENEIYFLPKVFYVKSCHFRRHYPLLNVMISTSIISISALFILSKFSQIIDLSILKKRDKYVKYLSQKMQIFRDCREEMTWM